MRTRQRATIAALCLLIAAPAAAEIRTKEITYKQGDTTLQGYVAWDNAVADKRPGILVIHEWWGHNEHARHQAVRLAEAGYIGFAVDMYGKGKVATHPKDAEAFMNEVLKASLAGPRFDAALAQLKKDPHVDPTRIAAIGYCFGGGVALGMARDGAPLAAVVSFHGGMPPPVTTPTPKGQVKGRILLLAGEADPMVPLAQVEAFVADLKASGADVTLVTYPGVKHSFTNPDAAKYPMEGLAYDAKADAASWAAAMTLLHQVFR
jgi:dienelactone hydrolase